jgi:hypothetical protein
MEGFECTGRVILSAEMISKIGQSFSGTLNS